MSAPQRVLVTGARGQLGTELRNACPPGVELVALDRAQLDVGDRAAVRDAVARARPQLVINAAAYTAVDKAESERDAAFRINGEGAGHVAEAAAAHGARVFQVSTDYVFDGTQATPYRPDDATNPINTYGASKLAGERAVLERAARAVVVRTAWVYAKGGHNFVNTMLRLLREREEVRVVCDQLGTPTHAASLARALWRLAERPEARGILHYTDAGVASWYDFAVAIKELAGLPARVVPIPTSAYPTPAKRPACAVLDKASGWALTGAAPHWRESLAQLLE